MRAWSQQDLANRLEELKYPMARSTITKIEGGGKRAENASVTDVLALAAALGVAPVHLLVPLEDDVHLQITPGNELPAPLARAWIRGQLPIDFTPAEDDLRTFLREQPKHELQALVERALVQAHMRGTSLAHALLGRDKLEQGIRESPEFKEHVRAAMQEIQTIRRERTNG